MKKPSPFLLRANSFPVCDVRLRHKPGGPEVVVRDQSVGTFAVDDSFLLEVPESVLQAEDQPGGPIGGWQAITIERLISLVQEQAANLRHCGSENCASCEVADGRSNCAAREDARSIPSPESFAKSGRPGHNNKQPSGPDWERTLRKAEWALFGAGIPHVVLGGYTVQNRYVLYSDTIDLVVPDPNAAMECLCRHGFSAYPNHPFVALDPQPNIAVRLIHGDIYEQRAIRSK